MLNKEMQTVIEKLHQEGHSARAIAEVLHISRNSVRRVIKGEKKQGSSAKKGSCLAEHLELIEMLSQSCQGNLVRVKEELAANGVNISYQALTRFCRKQGLSQTKKKPVGQYILEIAEEMQHDTSPHRVVIGSTQQKVQCASVVLCYSRMVYAQVYPTYNRLYCKAFLTEAILYFQGAAGRCMVDNTNIVVQCGSGKNAVISEEMASFARHFGFIFVAHRIGDANRSARVERSLWYIEENFYPGRQFTSLPDLNSQLRQWCETVNHRYREKLKAKPVELYQAEKAHLKPLPIYIPEVYELLPRIVDTEGYVNLHANRYSVPYELIGRKVEVKEGLNQIVVLKDNEVVATHPKKDGGGRFRVTLPEHRPKRDNSSQEKERPLSPEEQALRTHPGLASFLDQAFHHTGKSALFIRRLYQFYLDYPTESVEKVLQIACNFGLYDLGRIERMILRSIAGDYFRLQEFYHPIQKGEDTDESEIKGTPTEREPEPTADPAETHEDSGNSGGGT